MAPEHGEQVRFPAPEFPCRDRLLDRQHARGQPRYDAGIPAQHRVGLRAPAAFDTRAVSRVAVYDIRSGAVWFAFRTVRLTG
ncbi:hypothetical protein [Nocardia sp. CC227C]|uniref:hypothetical protein n=1 Tax=Nocardia sp. CC227C TaxID=3044562 RepID=UPI00278C2D35|nr:hypothetical protein [Nocardia sp. CC227C]